MNTIVPLASIDETEDDQLYSCDESAVAPSSGVNSFQYFKYSDLTSLSSVYPDRKPITPPVPPSFLHSSLNSSETKAAVLAKGSTVATTTATTTTTTASNSQHSRQGSLSTSHQEKYNHSLILSPTTSDYYDDQTPTSSSSAGLFSASTTMMMIDATINSTASAQDDEYGDTGFFSSSMSLSSKRSSIDDISGTMQLAQPHSHTHHSHHASHAPPSISYYSMDSGTNQFSIVDDEEEEEEEDDDDKLLLGDLILDDHIESSDIGSRGSRQTLVKSPLRQSSKSKLSGSLQDLVNSFDDQVKSCLRNYKENVSALAPVQIRSPEEVIKDRPAWWTLTGNYGNILPIDWTKLTPIDGADHRPTNCFDELSSSEGMSFEEDDDETEDEKLKHLISSCLELNCNRTPMKTADEVLAEIDAIIAGSGSSTNCSSSVNGSGRARQSLHRPLSHTTHSSSVRNSLSRSSSISSSCFDSSMFDVPIIKRLSFYPFALDKLKSFNIDQLQDLFEDLDHKVNKHSELLVKELATRDELEFEKEVKNTFLSLLILIQNRHRIEQKNRSIDERELQKRSKQTNDKDKGQKEAQENSVRRRKQLQFLTTVIPYQKNVTSNSVPTLQALIKILKAMNDDSPAVPNLLTDYILTYVCPASDDRPLSNNSNDLHHKPKSAVNFLNSKISALSTMTSNATTGSYSKLKARLSFSSLTSNSNLTTSSINSSRASSESPGNINNNNDNNFENLCLDDDRNNNGTPTAPLDTKITNHHQNRPKFECDSNAIVV